MQQYEDYYDYDYSIQINQDGMFLKIMQQSCWSELIM
jgi:hypothetical protein